MATSADVTAVAQKYVRVFNSATRDTDRFAALMLLGRVIKEEKCVLKADVLKHMDLSFIARMLKADSAVKNEDDSEVSLRSCALAVLQRWAVDEELMQRSEFLQFLRPFGEMISTPADSARSEALESCCRDVYNCLVSMIAKVEGRVALLEQGMVPRLVEAELRGCPGSDTAVQILVFLSQCHEAVLWEHHPTEMTGLVRHLASKARSDRNALAFATFGQLAQLVRGADSAFRTAPDWMQEVAGPLCDALKSKIPPDQRQLLLRLASELTLLFGLSWLPAARDKCLLAQLAAVEVGVTLEYSVTFATACASAQHLVACFCLLEAVIRWLAASEDVSAAPDLMASLIGRFDEALGALARLLQRLADEHEALRSAVTDSTASLLLTASVRLLGAWLAQEDWERVLAALPEELLSSLQRIVAVTSPERQEFSSMVRFLIPAFCHLSSAASHRQLLIAASWPHLVASFGLHCLNSEPGDLDSSLCGVINVLLNFLLERIWLPEIQPLLEMIVARWRQLIARNDLFLALHLGLLLTAVLTARPEALSDRARLFAAEVILSVFERASPSQFRRTGDATTRWDDLEGLWRLNVQLFADFLESEPSCVRLLQQSGDAQTVANIAEGLAPCDPACGPLRTLKAVLQRP